MCKRIHIFRTDYMSEGQHPSRRHPEKGRSMQQGGQAENTARQQPSQGVGTLSQPKISTIVFDLRVTMLG